MSGLTVHILTTAGPATIQRIREEDQHVASVICLDGRAESLPVSASYDAFVRSPIGVIEKLTGHSAYRMDVSSRVDDGRSWQLATYIAHVAQLHEPTPELHVFATGEVDDGLAVRAVEHVREKIQAFSKYLETHEIPGERAMVLVPESVEDLPSSVDGIPVYSVGSISQSLELIGLGGVEPAKAVEQAEHATKKKSLLRWIVLGLAGVLMFWFGADFSRWEALSEQGRAFELEEALSQSSDGPESMRVTAFRKWLTYKRPHEADVNFDGFLSIAETEALCDAPQAVKRLPLMDKYDDRGVICEIEMNAFSKSTSVQVVGRMAYWPDGLGIRDRALRIMRGNKKPDGRTWTLPFKQYPQAGASVRLVSILGTSEIVGTQPWYADLVSAPRDSASFDAAKQRIENLGYRVVIKEWKRQ